MREEEKEKKIKERAEREGPREPMAKMAGSYRNEKLGEGSL